MNVKEKIRRKADYQNIFRKKPISLKERLNKIDVDYMFLNDKDRLLLSDRRNLDEK